MDPRPIADVLDGLGRERGWGERLAFGRLAQRWPEVAGEVIAAHSEPVRLDAGTLVVRAESGPWATELALLAKALTARAQAVLGASAVSAVRVVSDPEPKRPSPGWKGPAQRPSKRGVRYGEKGL
jgi:predicted nucleic acid-binding Zn ribbon protein